MFLKIDRTVVLEKLANTDGRVYLQFAGTVGTSFDFFDDKKVST